VEQHRRNHVPRPEARCRRSFAAGSTIALYGRGGSNVTVNPQPGLPVISEVVTSGSQSSVTVSSIPSTYRDIKIVVSGRGTTAATSTGLNLTLNGDSGSNYDFERLYSNGTSMGTPANGLAQTSIYFADLVAASATAGVSSTAEMTIYNYAGTTFQKALDGVYQLKNGTAAAGNFFTFKNSGWWRSTSAVTSLTLTPAAGAFQDGTVVTVYGIGGSPTATLPVVPPQLRLTLTSNTPVMNADATAQTTVYATPYQGNILPVGNVMYRTAQISYALNTTAHVSGSLYDFFAYNASGAIALCTGPGLDQQHHPLGGDQPGRQQRHLGQHRQPDLQPLGRHDHHHHRSGPGDLPRHGLHDGERSDRGAVHPRRGRWRVEHHRGSLQRLQHPPDHRRLTRQQRRGLRRRNLARPRRQQ
jgi:hypothetical protein